MDEKLKMDENYLKEMVKKLDDDERLEFHKFKKKIDKIHVFFEEKMPEIIIFANLDEMFLEMVDDVIIDFLKIDRNVDYRHYPWAKKIKEKREELLGF